MVWVEVGGRIVSGLLESGLVVRLRIVCVLWEWGLVMVESWRL